MSTSLLEFQSTGDKTAPTILFLHGGGVAGWMWDPVVARMQDFHCLVPDLPEHGNSMAVKPFTMELAANQVIDLIPEQAPTGKAVVVGLSEGAQVVVQMLAMAPEIMEKALVSSALLLPMPGSRFLYSPALLAWMFRLSIPPFRHNEWWMRLNMQRAAAIPDEFFPQYKANFQIINESQFVNLMVANQQFRLPANLGKVSVPTLVIAGKHEYAIMHASVRLLARTLPNAYARLVDLGKGANMAKEHNWAMNAPDLFAQTLRNFIRGSELPPGLLPIELGRN